MHLNNRVKKLENTMSPKRTHVVGYNAGEKTEKESVKAYCIENEFDPEKFENGDYGEVTVVRRVSVSSDGTRYDH